MEEVANMETTVSPNESSAIRSAAIRVLEARSYKVVNVSKGSGSPPFSRIEATMGTDTLVCAVKAVMKEEGRIHFTRDDDGTWKVLRKVDHVVHAWRDPVEPEKVRVSLFDAKTITEAFDANHAAKEKEGMSHIPSWISPEHEDGWRFMGSGFGNKALWSETISLTDDLAVLPSTSTSSAAPSPEMGIMDRIKLMLSEHLGVRLDLIEVDVRVKF